MAAQEALDAEPDAAEKAEAFDGFVGVLGAGRFKAAGTGEEDREVRLVATQRKKSGTDGKRGWNSAPRHTVFSSFRSSVVRTEKGAVATLGLG